jgi:hypothetical protein
MRALLGACLVAFSCADVHAQAHVEGVTQQQLHEVRRTEEARFLALEQTCYTRFAVFDCLQQVRAQRRLVLDDLRRKEVALNDMERKKKAADQLEQIREKTSFEKLEAENSRRQEAMKAQIEREVSAANKKAEQLTKPSSNAKDKQSPPALGASSPAENAAKNKLDFDRKIKEAQDHRESREKSRLEKKADKPAQPLPLE